MTTGFSARTGSIIAARIAITTGLPALIVALAPMAPGRADWNEQQLPAEQGEWSLNRADGCPEAFFIGARGSGQNGVAGGPLNMGSQVESAYRHFSRYVHATPLANGLPGRAAPLGVDYPAVPAITYLFSPAEYEASVAAGRDDLLTKIDRVTARCGPTTRFVLAGFSQGAHVVTEALWSVPTKHRAQIEAVVLIASPVYQHGEARKQLGGADPSWRGLLGPSDLPDWVKGRSADLCLDGDVICTSSGTDHANIPSGLLKRAGRWAGRRAMHPLPVATPRCDGARASHIGTRGNDEITGTNGRDVVVAKRGNDVVNGRSGADVICAGGGKDLVQGRGGDDLIFAGAGNDTIRGGLGNDSLWGNAGFDRCAGGPGINTIDPSCEIGA